MSSLHSSAGEASMSVGLVAGRSKRSTAGNRMRALLDQQHHLSSTVDEADEIFREEDIDEDFAAPQREEEDVFDSDFGDSSDEDRQDQGEGEVREGRRKGVEEDEEAGERELEAEEDKRRKAARRQASRIAPSVVRRPTKAKPPPSALPSRSDQTLEEPFAGPSSRSTRSSRRISFAPGVDDRVRSGNPNSSSRRISSRRATVQAGLDSQVRIEEAEARRLQHPNVRNPTSAVKKPSLNQADLIELALEREEENRKSLKEWMEVEEARRKNELGREKKPLPHSWLRWRSVRSTVLIEAPPIVVLDAPERAQEADATTIIKAKETSEGKSEPEGQMGGQIRGPDLVSADDLNDADVSGPVNINTEAQADVSGPIIIAGEARSLVSEPATAAGAPPPTCPQGDIADSSLPSAAPHTPLIQAAPVAIGRVDFTLDPVLQARKEAAAAAEADSQRAAAASATDQVAKTNSSPTGFVSRSLVSLHYHGRPAAPWPEQWASLLGSHTDWATTYVVPARNRPSKSRASLCAITGKIARYRDALTGIPFADVKAARILRRLVDEEQWEWREVDINPRKSESHITSDVGKAADTLLQDSTSNATEESSTTVPTTKKVKKMSGRKMAEEYPGGDGEGKTGFWMSAQSRSERSGAAGDDTTIATVQTSGTLPSLKRKASKSASTTASSQQSAAASKKKKLAGASHAAAVSCASSPPSSLSATTKTTVLSTSRPSPMSTLPSSSTTSGPPVEEVPAHLAKLGIAPGDEQAVLARALALPSGTTRSGKARGSLKPDGGGGDRAGGGGRDGPQG